MLSVSVIFIYPFVLFECAFVLLCFRTLKHSTKRNNIAEVEHFIVDGLKEDALDVANV